MLSLLFIRCKSSDHLSQIVSQVCSFPKKNWNNQPFKNAFVHNRGICAGSNPSYGGHTQRRRFHPTIHGDAQPHPHDCCHPQSQGRIECVPGTECGTHAERTHAVRPCDDIHATATVRTTIGEFAGGYTVTAGTDGPSAAPFPPFHRGTIAVPTPPQRSRATAVPA